MFVINFTWSVRKGKALGLQVQSHRDQIGQGILTFFLCSSNVDRKRCCWFWVYEHKREFSFGGYGHTREILHCSVEFPFNLWRDYIAPVFGWTLSRLLLLWCFTSLFWSLSCWNSTMWISIFFLESAAVLVFIICQGQRTVCSWLLNLIPLG